MRLKLNESNYDDIKDMSFDEQCSYLCNYVNDVHTYDDMKDFIISNINSDDLYLALHVLEAITNDNAEYYLYDMGMGTMETPSSINDEEDIQSILDLYY